ncbi:Aste57867_21904 [Aphanomyces stellatus]|uniref:Aste57867_21904 protein n=1 Tax=Aphanomyces stellatus TaxID=120398 RepID=A0A485LIS7_9STRA|nr:hypothetical protein As57867_021835 [Aphanomyces stellatus]VFT98572.1 Aste57867_21904 [Aphanomyces stellatus]
MPHLMPSTTMPLPADYFSRTPLPPARMVAYDDDAKAHLDAALDRLQTERDQSEVRVRSWSHAARLPFHNEVDEYGYSILEKDGARVRFKKVGGGYDGDVDFSCRGVVDGHPHELMELMYADNTLDLRQWGKIYFPSFFLDGAVLHCLQRRPTDTTVPVAFTGLCWMAWRAPRVSTAAVHNTDTCFLKSMGVTTDHSGKDVHYMLLSSVDVPNCPLQERPLGLVRSKIRIAVLFQATSKGATRMYMFGSIEPHISLAMPQRAVESVAVALLTTLANLSVYLESYRISKKPFVDRLKWIPDSARRACYLCRHSFSFFRARHHCRACGEIMCKKCMVLRPLYNHLAKELPVESTGEKFCKPCVLLSRTMPPKEQRVRPTASLDPAYIETREPLRWTTLDASRLQKPREPVRRSDGIPIVARSKPMEIRSQGPEDVANGRVTPHYVHLSSSMPTPTGITDTQTPKSDVSMSQQLWTMSCRATATWNFAKETTERSRQSTPQSTPRSGKHGEKPTDSVLRESILKMQQALMEQTQLLEAITTKSRLSMTSPLRSTDRNKSTTSCGGWDDHRFEVIPDDVPPQPPI